MRPQTQDDASGQARGWSPWWNRTLFTLYAGSIAFAAYFCMYGLRKPLDALVFAGEKYPGTSLDLKTACVIGQIIGYAISKYLGARICSQANRGQRAWILIGSSIAAELGFLGFAVVPISLQPVLALVNGLPLGMVWGLIVRHLEGRQSSDFLLVMLSGSFVIAGAVTKDICLSLMEDHSVPECWAPAATGALFLVPFIGFAALLGRLPPPTKKDEEQRAKRLDLDALGRRGFLQRMGWGFGLLLLAYFLLTAFRDFRDHYGREILKGLGQEAFPGMFTLTDRWSLVAALGSLGLVNLFQDHRRALLAVLGFVVGGLAVVEVATLGYLGGFCSGMGWMSLVGVGLYLAYVPFGTVLLERLVAAARFSGTSVFAVQLADGVGYTGSVVIQLLRDSVFFGFDRAQFFLGFSLVFPVLALVLTLAGFQGVWSKLRQPG